MTLIVGHLNQLLSGYATKGASNKAAGYVADVLAPVVPVANQSDGYVVFGDEDLRLDNSHYKGGAQVNRVSFTESDDSYRCQEFALESPIPWSKMKNADAAIRLEQRHAAGLGAKLRLRREAAVATLLTGATFTNTAALAAADRWNVDTSNPVKKVREAIAIIRGLSGLEPNTLAIGAEIWDGLSLHPDITSRVAGLVAGTPATKEQAAAALGVDRVLVSSAVRNTALEGQTASYSPVWGKTACVCYVDPNAGGDVEGVITPAQQFVWSGLFAPFSISTYEDEQSMSHILRCYDAVDVKAIAVNSLYRFTTVVD